MNPEDWPRGVRKKDLRIEFFRGSGPGGQHRNKTDTACRMTHIPTGISAESQRGRSQDDNRESAFRKLAAKLVPLMKAEAQGERPSATSDERVRSYHEPDQRVTDHRTGKKYRYSDVLSGKGLDEVINDLFRHAAQERKV